MKRALFVCLGVIVTLFADYEPITDPSAITYDWLVGLGETTAYSDHISHFKKFFDSYNDKPRFLEFGLGYSTKYFLDRCDQVISIEFVTNGAGPGFIQEMIKLYAGIHNWIPCAYLSDVRKEEIKWTPFPPRIYEGSTAVSTAASVQCSTHMTYAWTDASYLKELNLLIDSIVAEFAIDVAFVDPGIYIRGDLVQLLFDKVPIIVAHDSKVRAQNIVNDVYGYTAIVTPSHYEEIYIAPGQGTTFWIHKEPKYAELIEEMKDYAKRAG